MTRNFFRGALLETLLLSLINNSSTQGLYGYAIFLAVQQRFGVRLGPSTLYPELNRLERLGFVSSSVEIGLGRIRRRYRITGRGQTVLWENSMQLKTVVPLFAGCTRSD